MEIRNLKSFIEVCENQSFSKAANHLGYTQSTITAQMNQLEEELGVPLFDRRGKTFTVNENGYELLDYARRIIALTDEAISAVSDRHDIKGKIRVGIIESLSSYFIPPILEKYLTTYKDVSVEFFISKTLDIMDALRQNKVDLIVTLDEPVFEPTWELVWKKPESVVFLCSPDHRFAGLKDVPLEELVKDKIILTEKDANYRYVFDRECRRHDLVPDSPLEVGNTSLILDLTEKGVGITLLPEVTAKSAIAEGCLSTFTVMDLRIDMFIQLFHRKDKWVTPASRAFQQMVMEA